MERAHAGSGTRRAALWTLLWLAPAGPLGAADARSPVDPVTASVE